MRLKIEAIQRSPEHLAIYKLMIAGVGFRQYNGYYEFYSHGGDYIGTAAIYRVEAFVCFMRKNFGIRTNEYPHRSCGGQRALTFGYHNLIEHELCEQWMDELWRNPITLH